MKESKEVQVSICCITYNQEKYIAECLEGFIMQKGVSFEVLVVDDASNDNTQRIICEYTKKYPEIIKPVLLATNHVSKGIWTDQVFNYPRARGQYIALCEGDDKWTDQYKLKKQYDALQNNRDCKMSVHAVSIVNHDASRNLGLIPKIGLFSEGIVNKREVIDAINLGIYPFHTSSFFLDAEIFKYFASHLPQYAEISWIRDVPVMLYFASVSDFYYIDESMSYYRTKDADSYHNDIINNKEWCGQHFQLMLQMFESYEKHTNNLYDLSGAKKIYLAEYYCVSDQLQKLLKLIASDFPSIKPVLRDIASLAFRYKTPGLFRHLKTIKKKLIRTRQ